MQVTKYNKIPEDRQEGWLRWLAEGARVGCAGMKGYVGGYSSCGGLLEGRRMSSDVFVILER